MRNCATPCADSDIRGPDVSDFAHGVDDARKELLTARYGPGVAHVVVSVSLQTTLDQVLLGLRPLSDLPGEAGDTYVDEEGTPIARWSADDTLSSLIPARWEHPSSVRSDAPVVVPVPDVGPATSLPPGTTLLLPASGVRIDDARFAAWSAAWSASAARVIPVPYGAIEADERRGELASAYSSGPLLSVATQDLPVGGGVTVLLSGLSGSGKSTIARALVARLVLSRTVTLLDGDVVRTHLSRGLGFSREDRDVNVRRIGWVAAEVTKHGGAAVCAPIAPYDETRRWVRSVVEAAGGPGSFVLVWVATPLEVCEARDVKGLYAKARAGEITGFTGIDDPYEPPLDAELVIDTSVVSVDDAVTAILAFL
jgi:sulfate adenylyltransferase